MKDRQNAEQKKIDQVISDLFKQVLTLINLKKYDDAQRFLEEIIKYKPDYPDSFFQLGNIFMAQNQFEKAIEQYMQVLKKRPDVFENLNNIGTAYYKLKKYDDAVFYYKKALAIQSDVEHILWAVAVCFAERGALDEAIGYYRRTLNISTKKTQIYSDLLLTMIYAESVTPEALAEEARKFGKNIAEPVQRKKSFANGKDPERKLRIGYVSPDYRDHPIPYFLEPLLKLHDRKNFEIFSYSNTSYDNPIMERMKKSADFWRDLRDLNSDAAYSLIYSDQIDILIDMAGHTAANSLMVFARKPAPVQVTWLGYPATTGMKAMDYRITDHYVEPVGMTEHLNAETLWRLPKIFCCYQGHENSPTVIDHPPFEDNGYITFGCFNNFMKVRDPVLAAWGRILKQVPNSRLLLEIPNLDDPKFCKTVEDRLKKQDVPMDRVMLELRTRTNQFVLYNKIDIALDPFPCCGGTTSMDTLWMGVPLITLAGQSFVSRMGVTILTNAGLPELIAYTTEKYIELVVDLAQDRARLKKIRHNLRDRFSSSPAMDQKSFTQDMEEAYRGMWRKYCVADENRKQGT